MSHPRFVLTVQKRLGLLTLIGMAGVLAVSAVDHFASQQLETLQHRSERSSSAALLVATLGQDLLEARRAEKDFLLRAEETYVTRHAAIVQRVSSDLSQLGNLLADGSLDASLKPQFRAIHAGFSTYQTAFADLVGTAKTLGMDEKSGLQGTLRASVHEVEARLGQVDELRLSNLMLMMRRHEKDFMLRLDPKYAQDLKKRAGEFEIALGASALPHAARSEIASRMAAYQRDAVAYIEGRLRQVEATKTLSKSYAELAPVVDSVATAVRQARTTTKAEIQQARGTTEALRWSLAGLVLVFSGLASFLMGRSLAKPLARVTSAVQQLAAGDTAVAVPGRSRADEIGALAASVEVFRDNMIRGRQLEEETELARTDAEVQRKAAMREMANGFERAVSVIVEMVTASATELQATAQGMAGTATQTAHQSTMVAAAAEKAAANVNTVAAAAEELGSSVEEIGRQVNSSASLAQRAVAEADQTATLVQELSGAVSKIGDVVAMISTIAGQTNLLALNATIEAARAGEAGRGFAVVATEVKELASQTAKATEEISSQIARIQGSTGQAVGAIENITARIQEISSVATTIAASVEEQGAATQEIVRNVSQAAVGTSQVTTSIGGVASATEETGAAASQVLASASELSRQSEHLSIEVARFLATVRAA